MKFIGKYDEWTHIIYRMIAMWKYIDLNPLHEIIFSADNPPSSRSVYHGRNALLDIDPQSIQQPMSRQDSFEQNDDRSSTKYSDRVERPRPRQQPPVEHDSYVHRRVSRDQSRVNITTSSHLEQEDEDDGDWC